MMMKKIAKRVLAAAMAVCMMAPVAGISVCAEGTETKTTNVTYTVTEAYSWSVPTEIALGDGEKSDTVSVTDCVIPTGQKLQITAVGSGDGNAFTVTADGQILGYTIAVNGASLTSGGVVLEVIAGTSTGSATLKFNLAEGVAATYAGSYTGTVTYTASVVAQ